MTIHPDLLAILACPKCKGELTPPAAGEGLACPACGVVYPVREDIPIMLVEEAVPAADWEAGKRSVKD
ncbi:MAG: Trm112 family protein [Solidesulfovibrio sp. DCME]|uniref:Trm112 family protein n=1 Tax=unclassified Solidesulfovibrio TaxID=2910989 RepID=UPI002B1F5066|nr:Trm112 family protein [Solidesulfovibrio sp.]MEA4858122.1 Trm112 family protein [Solidesulfovibrio sp.]